MENIEMANEKQMIALIKKQKREIDAYEIMVDKLREEQGQKLPIHNVTPRFFVSLVYQNSRANMLRTLITDAKSKDEALGKAIKYFNKETDGYGLILKAVTDIYEG